MARRGVYDGSFLSAPTVMLRRNSPGCCSISGRSNCPASLTTRPAGPEPHAPRSDTRRHARSAAWPASPRLPPGHHRKPSGLSPRPRPGALAPPPPPLVRYTYPTAEPQAREPKHHRAQNPAPHPHAEPPMAEPEPVWHDLGPVEDLKSPPLRQLVIGRTRIPLAWGNGEFGAISGASNPAGGPLGEGRLDGDYITCPWHNWKYHRVRGEGEPGYEDESVPRHEGKIGGGHVFVNLEAATKRHRIPHEPHPLARKVERGPGPVRVAGISTTAMDAANPRFSTSEVLLETALRHAGEACHAETRLIRLNDLKFRHCEGYYSKSAHACTWPCSITQMDPADQMDQVYEAIVHWGDVILIATPIRWGSASSLFHKMAERLNCVQNQVTIRNRVLIRNKVAGFIITGGQDNVQEVAGHLMMFFGELGFLFPQFPFIAHSRGWSAEDMENNVREVGMSKELMQGAEELADRAVQMAAEMVKVGFTHEQVARGGRKAHHMA